MEPAALANSDASASIAAMKVPIWIGARSLPDDGVIGFQVGDVPERLERTVKLVAGRPSLTIDVPTGSQSKTLTLLVDPRGKIYLESGILPALTIQLRPEWVNEVAQKLPAVLRVAPALIHSHALLRSILTPDSASSENIDLPLPIDTTSGVADKPAAILSTDRGIDISVKPLSTTGVVPERQVAAIEGILVV